MYEAHSTVQAQVKQCHKELTELYEEQLREKGLTVSFEPASCRTLGLTPFTRLPC
jgi:hypothetical protein